MRLQYLFFGISAGCCSVLSYLIGRPSSHIRAKFSIAAAMGLCSVAGQFFTGLALARDVAGHVAFSISTGGTLFIVALAGILAL